MDEGVLVAKGVDLSSEAIQGVVSVEDTEQVLDEMYWLMALVG
jgi:hypothetical protein